MGELDLLTTPNFSHSSSVCSMVGLWNLELFLVNWILCYEVDFVFEILGETHGRTYQC